MPSFVQRFVVIFGDSLDGLLKTKKESKPEEPEKRLTARAGANWLRIYATSLYDGGAVFFHSWLAGVLLLLSVVAVRRILDGVTILAHTANGLPCVQLPA